MAGSRKGIPNKRTAELQSALLSLGVKVPERICEILKSDTPVTLGGLSEKDKLWAYLELLQYLYPKRKAVEVEDVTEDKKYTFNIKWADEYDSGNTEPKKTDSGSEKN